MRLLYTLLLLSLFTLPAFSQIEDGSIVSHNDEFEPCVIHETDTTGAAAARMKLKQVRERNMALRASCGYDTSAVPLYLLLVYDDQLLSTYTQSEVEEALATNVLQSIIESNKCAGIPFSNYKAVFQAVEVKDDYASVYDAQSMIESPNGELHWLVSMKESNDFHYLIFFTKPSATGKGVAGMVTPDYSWFATTVFAVVNYQQVEFGSVTATHEFGHMNGLDHEDPWAGPVSATTSRAYAGNTAWSSVKSAGNLTKSVRCWSGPDSYAIDYLGDTIQLFDGNCDNAMAMRIGIPLFRDVIDRTMVQTSGVECGSGTVQACTNNADIWSWEVLSGDVELLSDLNQPSMEYIAYEPSTIRVIGQMTGKLYADTVTIDLPGIESEERDTSVYVGSSLPDGQIVLFPGSYEVILPGEGSNGCDLLVNYNVDLIAAVDDKQQNRVQMIPNPTTGKVTITKMEEIQEVKVYSITGSLMSTQYKENMVDLSDLPPGTYLLQVISDRGIFQGKVMKH
ncbi:MAG: zinc-dependent metalloprotease [Saprospiraceae bacterium]